jgi:polyribonucleotide nucleotidyltransferase
MFLADIFCSSGFVKRDGRPKTSETLVSRLVDRSLRPAFAPGWTYDTQVPSIQLQG